MPFFFFGYCFTLRRGFAATKPSSRSPVGPAPPLGDKHSTKKSLPAPSLVVSSSPPVVEGGWRGPGGTPSSLVDSRGRSTEIRRINGENAGSVVVSLHRVDPGSGEGARKGSWTDVQSSSSGEDVDESEEEDLPWLKHSLGRLNRHRGNSPQLPVPNSPGSASHLSTSSRSSHRSVSPRLDDWKSQPGVQDKTVAATSLSPGPVGRKRSSSLLSTLRSQESANSFERSFVIEVRRGALIPQSLGPCRFWTGPPSRPLLGCLFPFFSG